MVYLNRDCYCCISDVPLASPQHAYLSGHVITATGDVLWHFVNRFCCCCFLDVRLSVTQHAYLSEHVITADLKKAMRKAIRDNRVKHTRHKTASNFEVIRRCTNMW